MERYAVIVAGGIGTRMEARLPKQFLPLGSKLIIEYAIDVFLSAQCKVIIVLPAPCLMVASEYLSRYLGADNITFCNGGQLRSDSVANGLALVPENAIVAVHDAARPFIDVEFVNQLFEEAGNKETAIPAVEVKDSIRRVDESGNYAVDRASYRLIQTPQVFTASTLKKAFQLASGVSATDEASLYEQFLQTQVNLVPGLFKNLKITTPEDLLYARALIAESNKTN